MTLTESKSPITDSMSEAICKLLDQYRVAIISGGKFDQLKQQIADHLLCSDKLATFYILPTSGVSLYTYTGNQWKSLYRESIPQEERAHIIATLEETLQEVEKEKPAQIYGERIEDRGTQITFSALGQEAPLEHKLTWDPDQSKRKHMQSVLEPKLPGFRIGIGGSTSLDITKEGHDKGFGIKRLLEHLNIPIEEALFMGDALFPGGNDYPAVSTGIECIETTGPKETEKIIATLLANPSN